MRLLDDVIDLLLGVVDGFGDLRVRIVVSNCIPNTWSRDRHWSRDRCWSRDCCWSRDRHWSRDCHWSHDYGWSHDECYAHECYLPML